MLDRKRTFWLPSNSSRKNTAPSAPGVFNVVVTALFELVTVGVEATTTPLESRRRNRLPGGLTALPCTTIESMRTGAENDNRYRNTRALLPVKATECPENRPSGS